MIFSKTLRRPIAKVVELPEPYYGCPQPCEGCKRRWELRNSAIVAVSVHILENYPNVPNKEIPTIATELVTAFDCAELDLSQVERYLPEFTFYSNAEADFLVSPVAGRA